MPSAGRRRSMTAMRRVAEIICLTGLLAGAAGAAGPTTAPTPWGTPKAGLQVSAAIDGGVRVGGKLSVRLALRNVGAVPVNLPAPERVFGWMVIVYSREKAYITQRVFPAKGLAGWPKRLAQGRIVRLKPADLMGLGAYPYSLKKQLYGSYLDAKSGSEPPKAATTVGKVLTIGLAKARIRLCVPRPGERAVVLASNTLDVLVGPPDMKTIAPEVRKAFMRDLLKQFDRDAWGGQSAHRAAVKLGPAALDELIPAAFERLRPAHSRMWLATALADIRDARSAAALIKLLDATLPGVRHVVAYHGPKQRSAALDKAILAKAARLKESRMTALAILGSLVFRGAVPGELLKLGLDSADPRTRAAVAHAMAARASGFNVSRLVSLLKDPDQRVRAQAARVLGAFKSRSPAVLGALVAALDLPGELARTRVCAALSELTGRNMPYDRSAGPQARQKTIQAWKNWWAKGNQRKG